MNLIYNMWQRDKEIFRFLKRLVIYPYLRFEHYRLMKTREHMNKIVHVSKQQMKKSGSNNKQWKWIYVVKESHNKKYKRNWNI